MYQASENQKRLSFIRSHIFKDFAFALASLVMISFFSGVRASSWWTFDRRFDLTSSKCSYAHKCAVC